MSRVQFTGLGRLFWVPDPTGAGAVVTLNAPTATQVNTGTDVTAWLRRDGLDRPRSGNLVDTSNALSAFSTTDLGTSGGDKITLKLLRDSESGNDDAWPLFERGNRGFLIVFPFGLAGASPAAGDRCEVYETACNTRAMAAIAENQAQMFTAELATVSPPNDDATLV